MSCVSTENSSVPQEQYLHGKWNVYFHLPNDKNCDLASYKPIKKDINAVNEVYASLFNEPPYKTEEVPSEGVNSSFFKCGESKIELLEATNPDSAIAKFIEKKGEGIHHIAIAVERPLRKSRENH